jgi:DNA transformation protein
MGDGFFVFVKELFAGLGPISIRRMFGGAGVYADGCMFALLADETIFIKVDAALKMDLAAVGSGPFVWMPDQGPKKGQAVEMSYWRLPDSALDDADEAAMWARRALTIARAAKAPKRLAKKSKRV